MSSPQLDISEIFLSIQGEASHAGWPCAFIRLAGCGHGCRFCDTRYAEKAEKRMGIEEVITQARSFGAPVIELTGGEPLLQEAAYPLMERLCDLGENVLLETGGFLSVERVDRRVHKIIDLKPPSSGQEHKNHMDNIRLALEASPDERNTFEFKLVLASREDYLWGRELLASSGLTRQGTIMMGVIDAELSPAELSAWILEDRLRVRMQLQLHKHIWPHIDRGR